ncbi:MAG: Bug family tripartite tricarboxylate transporter substrate binding protein [Advenella sp.]
MIQLPRVLRGILLIASMGVSHVHAQTYPEKPVVLINPYAAGGPADVLARKLASELRTELGQPVIVENKPGAAAAVGTAFVSNAKPDGYTLLMGTSAGHVVTPLLQKVAYDGIADFSFIGIVTRQSNMLVVNPALKVDNIKELIAYARAHPKQLNFGSAGAGGATHLSGEQFMRKTGVELVHVPYSGAAPALTDLMGGQVQLAFLNLSASLQYVKDGRLKALAYGADKRSPLLPDVPTMQEAGVPDAQVATWYSLAAPQGTPQAVIDRLNKALLTINRKPDYQAFLRNVDGEILSLTPAQATDFVHHDQGAMAELLQAIGNAK